MDTLDNAVYSALTVDALQTRYIGKNCHVYHEANPILGDCPNSKNIAAYFIASGLAYAGIKFILPDKYKEQFSWLVLGVEVGAIAHNVSIGIKVSGKVPEAPSKPGTYTFEKGGMCETGYCR